MWNITPFSLIEADEPGLTGGVALTAHGLAMGQSATFNIIRTLGIRQALGLSQSDYWVEGVTHAMSLVNTSGWALDRPFTISQALGISDAAPVSGGQSNNPIQQAPVDGSVSPGQAIYVKATGNTAVTVATAEATARVAGVAVSVSGSILYYLTDGALFLDDWSKATESKNLVPGTSYYLDATVNGNLTEIPPIGPGEFVVRVGRALNSSTLAIEIGEGVRL